MLLLYCLCCYGCYGVSDRVLPVSRDEWKVAGGYGEDFCEAGALVASPSRSSTAPKRRVGGYGGHGRGGSDERERSSYPVTDF